MHAITIAHLIWDRGFAIPQALTDKLIMLGFDACVIATSNLNKEIFNGK